MDSSLIDADASNNSVVDTHALKRHREVITTVKVTC
jgi:hypothetical protein